MKHIDIELKCTGDIITAISISLRIAKELKEVVYLKFPHHGDFFIGVNPESYCSDLVQVAQLEMKLREKIPK